MVPGVKSAVVYSWWSEHKNWCDSGTLKWLVQLGILSLTTIRDNLGDLTLEIWLTELENTGAGACCFSVLSAWW